MTVTVAVVTPESPSSSVTRNLTVYGAIGGTSVSTVLLNTAVVMGAGLEIS